MSTHPKDFSTLPSLRLHRHALQNSVSVALGLLLPTEKGRTGLPGSHTVQSRPSRGPETFVATPGSGPAVHLTVLNDGLPESVSEGRRRRPETPRPLSEPLSHPQFNKLRQGTPGKQVKGLLDLTVAFPARREPVLLERS